MKTMQPSRFNRSLPLLALALVAGLFVSPVAAQDSDNARRDRRENQEPVRSSDSGNNNRSQETRTNSNGDDEAQQTPRNRRNREEPRAETPAATENTPAPAAPATEAQPPPQKTTPPAAPSASFDLRANSNNLLLRLHAEGDPDNTDFDITEGGTFTTDVSLLNAGNRPFNTVRVIIDYNPSFIDPTVINDSVLINNLAEEPIIEVNRKLGQVVYVAKLREPMTTSQSLIYISWKAVKPTLFTNIRFGRNIVHGFTDILMDDAAMLGEPQEEGDGVVAAGVRVVPADPAEALMMQEEPSLYLSSDERVGGVQLSIAGPKRAPRVGEEFFIDLVIDNTVYSNFDKLSVVLEYDSEVFQVLDDDFDNWITHGVNIHDGSFHADFPFDYHIANAVYPSRGLIEYRMGTSQPEEFVGAYGTFARIKARAKKPTASTTVSYFFAPREGLRTTEVRYLGQDSLGDTLVKNDGARGLRFPVLPEVAKPKIPAK
jgi:hypothetical protein